MTPPNDPTMREAVLLTQNRTLADALEQIAETIEAYKDQVPSVVLETARLVATYAAVAGKERA